MNRSRPNPLRAKLIGPAAAVLVLSAAVPVPSDCFTAATGDFHGELLSGVRELTDTLLVQKDKLVTLLGNADLVLRTITDRHGAIAAMLADVNELTAVAGRLLSEHGPQFDTLLDQLHTITEQLSTSEQDLGKPVEQLARASTAAG